MKFSDFFILFRFFFNSKLFKVVTQILNGILEHLLRNQRRLGNLSTIGERHLKADNVCVKIKILWDPLDFEKQMKCARASYLRSP